MTTFPLGIFTVLWTLASVPTLCRSAAVGSSTRGSSWATTPINFSSPVSELTSASELSRPTVRGRTARKQDCIPNWQNRKDLRYREFFFSHEIPQRTTPNSLDQLDATDGPKVQILRTFKAINLSVSY